MRFHPMTISVVLFWTHSSMSVSFLYSAPQVQSQKKKCQIEGKNCLSQPASCIFINTAQKMVGLLYCRDTLLTHIQLGVNQDPRSFSADLLLSGHGESVFVHRAILYRCRTLLKILRFVSAHLSTC